MFEADDERIARSLTYHQISLLKILANTVEPVEGFALMRKSDCSFEDVYDLGHYGLLDPGFDRLAKNCTHPLITERGRKVLQVVAGMELIG